MNPQRLRSLALRLRNVTLETENILLEMEGGPEGRDYPPGRIRPDGFPAVFGESEFSPDESAPEPEPERRTLPPARVHPIHPVEPNLLLERQGLFHEPSPNKLVHIEKVVLPASFNRLRFVVTITTGPRTWMKRGSKLFFFGLKMRNLFGFAIVRRGQLILRSGFGMKMGPRKGKGVTRFDLEPHTSYSVGFLFSRDHAAVTICTEAGKPLAAATCPVPLVGKFPTGKLPTERTALVTFGGDDSVAEAAQYGWTFSDLEVSAG